MTVFDYLLHSVRFPTVRDAPNTAANQFCGQRVHLAQRVSESPQHATQETRKACNWLSSILSSLSFASLVSPHTQLQLKVVQRLPQKAATHVFADEQLLAWFMRQTKLETGQTNFTEPKSSREGLTAAHFVAKHPELLYRVHKMATMFTVLNHTNPLHLTQQVEGLCLGSYSYFSCNYCYFSHVVRRNIKK